MKTYIIRYGVIYGLVLLIGFFISYLILGTAPENFAKSEVIGYSVMILSSISIYFATKQYKQSLGGKPMRFFQGLKIGSGVSMIGGLFFGLYNWVYIRWLQPDFLNQYLAYSEQQIRQSGAEQAVIERQLGELATYSELLQNEFLYLLIMFMTVFVIGMAFSIVTAATLKD
ncbi:DUF4199 domain-containing protein [Aliiglaciecola lipolytica]|uniref:DUF4199 domain-containing protein n=1 Tax=Aliiglaciecola lipolytica E3 TaxID=1127673 RepID=K6X647_9ALTE|nr:DUF4199 domain-containing protein [Aliiglaciecola lipolytica]GAC16094.1 hypothetical protein GLIP_3480 [Aliiglaciecola lipolytica E3]